METRLEPVEGIPGGGQLYVRGPNVMAGYLDAGGALEPPADGWHDTGDVVVDRRRRLDHASRAG